MGLSSCIKYREQTIDYNNLTGFCARIRHNQFGKNLKILK
jgi:hypothetical protein